MTSAITVVLRAASGHPALLDRALFALAHQRRRADEVRLAVPHEAARMHAQGLAGLHSIDAQVILDDRRGPDPLLAGLRGRVLFLGDHDLLHPAHLHALEAALESNGAAPWALTRGRLALATHLAGVPFSAHKRPLWPPALGRFGPLAGSLPPAACALLDLDRLGSFELSAGPIERAVPSRALTDSLRVLRLSAHAAPAIAEPDFSFDHLAPRLPLRDRAQDVAERAWLRALKPALKSLRERARRLTPVPVSR
ncbi:MAG: hypothetical protein JST92_07170 [Deltaproteobacteria bacterium]|nr:hypothetical protein [Deltaproteobacteria bacterium]